MVPVDIFADVFASLNRVKLDKDLRQVSFTFNNIVESRFKDAPYFLIHRIDFDMRGWVMQMHNSSSNSDDSSDEVSTDSEDSNDDEMLFGKRLLDFEANYRRMLMHPCCRIRQLHIDHDFLYFGNNVTIENLVADLEKMRHLWNGGEVSVFSAPLGKEFWDILWKPFMETNLFSNAAMLKFILKRYDFAMVHLSWDLRQVTCCQVEISDYTMEMVGLSSTEFVDLIFAGATIREKKLNMEMAFVEENDYSEEFLKLFLNTAKSYQTPVRLQLGISFSVSEVGTENESRLTNEHTNQEVKHRVTYTVVDEEEGDSWKNYIFSIE